MRILRAYRLRSLVTATTAVSLVGALFSPAVFAKPPRIAHVRVETARLRSGPGEHHRAVGLLDAGRAGRVLGSKGDWVRVRLATGTEGWVHSGLLKVSRRTVQAEKAEKAKQAALARRNREAQAAKIAQEKARKLAAAKAQAKRVAAARVQARRVALAKAEAQKAAKPPVPVAKTATPLALPEEVADASRRAVEQSAMVGAATDAAPDAAPEAAAPESRTSNFAAASEAPAVRPAFQMVSAAESRAGRLIRSALSYRGTPYRMGARGQGAFDCSGFTSFLFAKAGSPLPRTAAEQFKRGTPIPKSQIKPGDLVFFKNTYKRGVSHVGIYIGNGQFVHASSAGGVRTNSLSQSYYLRHWAGARRAK